MKLGCSPRNHCASSSYFCSACIDEQQHRSDERRQALGQHGGALRSHSPRAFWVQHKTNGVCTGRDCRIEANCVLRGCRLGDGVTVGANSVLHGGDFSAGTIVPPLTARSAD